MTKVIITGCGAAPGVPALAKGWGKCDPNNQKNIRRRVGTYIESNGAKIIIDTSPDLRQQLLDHNIKLLDGVLYTHAHADHLHGIDDLRELNRIIKRPLNIYASVETGEVIKQRFSYLLTDKEHLNNSSFKPSLILNEVVHGKTFDINGLEIVPIALDGHMLPSTGYIIGNGEIVYIADCKSIPEKSLSLIKRKPKLLIIPLTCIHFCHKEPYHMDIDEMLEYVKRINPDQTIINHMAVECDYDEVNHLTPKNVEPAFDNMVIEI